MVRLIHYVNFILLKPDLCIQEVYLIKPNEPACMYNHLKQLNNDPNLLIPNLIPDIDVPEKKPFLVNSLADEDFHADGLPKFGKSPQLIEGTVGQTVILSCVVFNLDTKRVSGLNKTPITVVHILTIQSHFFRSLG